MIRIVVEGPIVPKGRPRFFSTRAGGRAYTPAKTRAYEAWVTQCAAQAMRGRDLIATPVLCVITAYFEPPRSWSAARRARAIGQFRPHKPDTDNISKIKDALNGVVWRDDAQVVEEHVRKRYGESNRLVIEVEEI